MDSLLDYHNHQSSTSSSNNSSSMILNGSSNSNRFQHHEEDDDSYSNNSNNNNKTTKKSTAPPPGTNTGRWSNDEHQRFLTGLEQFGTGNWKKITELVATRSCTQVRTHAQKYFLSIQKPEGGGSATKSKKSKDGRKKSRTAAYGLIDDDKKRSKKKFKYSKGGEVNGSGDPSSWLYGAAGGINSSNGVKRGLSGMSLLAQAALVDPEFERMDQTAEEYEKRHGRANEGDISSDDDDDEDDVAEDISVTVNDNQENHEQKQKHPSPLSTKKKQDTVSNDDSKQEIMKLREQLQFANQTVQHMRQELKLSEARALEAIEGRNIAINECRELQEMNNQLKTEHRRMVMRIENQNGFGGPAPTKVGSSPNNVGANAGVTPQAALSAGGLEQQMQSLLPSMAAAAHSQQLQHQDQIVIEVLQSRLKEAELRYHQVTESLARQTGVLTDQHRAVLELNGKLESERARRQAVEAELERMKRQRSN